MAETNSYGPNGKRQKNSYHAGYDQCPTDEPQQLYPSHVGYDPPAYEQSFGGPASPNPKLQQPRSHTGNRPIVVVTDLPPDLTIPAFFICFCFCWLSGCVGIYYANKANECFQQGDLQQGHRYQTRALIAMVLTVIIGIVSGLVIYYTVKSQY